MFFPEPKNGQVIRYSYLWLREHQRGQEEGTKDRPCAVILVTQKDEDDEKIVTVLPITHTPPSAQDSHLHMEIPHMTGKRLGLDDARSWIVLSEINRFVWPGPDLRPVTEDHSTILYGSLPNSFYEKVKAAFVQTYRNGLVKMVPRTK